VILNLDVVMNLFTGLDMILMCLGTLGCGKHIPDIY